MLLIRNPFSHTKKFFKKTLRSFRSLFTCDTHQFQKLPKSATCCDISFPYNTRNGIDFNPPGLEAEQYQELDKFYSDFTRKWDADDKKVRRRTKKKETVNVPSSIATNPKVEDQIREDRIQYRSGSSTSRSLVPAKTVRREDSSSKNSKREARSVLVAEKLKELEMMDMSDMDQVLDIEEVIHYYSRLSCPAYLEIIDKFFMDMYAEFTGQRNIPATVNVGSRNKFLSMRK